MVLGCLHTCDKPTARSSDFQMVRTDSQCLLGEERRDGQNQLPPDFLALPPGAGAGRAGAAEQLRALLRTQRLPDAVVPILDQIIIALKPVG